VGSYALACQAIAFGAPPDPSRAREATLALTACARPYPSRWQALRLSDNVSSARADDGSVIAFPYLSHPRAGLSHAEWRALGPGEKLERLFGMSLDDLYEILSWPIGELDRFRLSVRVQVTRVVFTVCLKAVLDGRLGREAARESDRERVLEELLSRF
jgi:hypothetical protein